jgi:DNA-directed RNA polymerase specialized sigma24 family protein
MTRTTLLEMPAPGAEAPQEDRGLSPLAFTRLLEWLDGGVDSQGETYLEMRRRLIGYFERRNRPFADDLADETFNRIGTTLEQDRTIVVTPQARYCYVVARFVLLEDIRHDARLRRRDQESRHTDVTSWPDPAASLVTDEALTSQEERLARLEHCLQALSPERRALITEYYRDVGQKTIAHRRDLATRLGITMNALSIRAHRIRALLEARMTGS